MSKSKPRDEPNRQTESLAGAGPEDTGESNKLGGPAIEGYEIIREISRGGQGVVYQALQRSTKRRVAIKLLLQGLHASKAAKRRFEREIELIAQLHHPSIISIFDSGETDLGLSYYVMDYIRGEPLHKYVHDKGLPLAELLSLFQELCETVQYAHQRGVMHRDLKPSNILVDSKGQIRILDFGLAKSLNSPEETIVSLSQDVVGTLPYISPEQAKGNPDEIDTRTDVYSLGVILYELLTHQFPYPVRGHPAEVLRHIAETPPKPLRKLRSSDAADRTGPETEASPMYPIDRTLELIVLKSLSKDSAGRYQSAAEFRSDIQRYQQDEPIIAVPPSLFLQAYLLGRRHKGVVTGIVIGLVAFFVAFAVCLNLYFQTQAALGRESTQLKLTEGARRTALRERDLAVEAEQVARERLEEIRERDLSWQLFFHKSLHGESVQTVGNPPSIETFLEAAGRNLENDLSGLLDAQTFLRASIGHAYDRLGLKELAEALKHQAREAASSDTGSIFTASNKRSHQMRYNEFIRMALPHSSRMIRVICDRSYAIVADGHTQQALEHLRKAIAICEGWEDGSEDRLYAAFRIGSTISLTFTFILPDGANPCPPNLLDFIHDLWDRCGGKYDLGVLRKLEECGHHDLVWSLYAEMLESKSPLASNSWGDPLVVSALILSDIAESLLSEDRVASKEELAATCEKIRMRLGEANDLRGRIASQIAFTLGRIGQFQEAERLLVEEFRSASTANARKAVAFGLLRIQGTYGPTANPNPIYDTVFELVQKSGHPFLYNITQNTGKPDELTAEIRFYEAWDKTRPGQAYGEKVVELRSKLLSDD